MRKEPRIALLIKDTPDGYTFSVHCITAGEELPVLVCHNGEYTEVIASSSFPPEFEYLDKPEEVLAHLIGKIGERMGYVVIMSPAGDQYFILDIPDVFRHTTVDFNGDQHRISGILRNGVLCELPHGDGYALKLWRHLPDDKYNEIACILEGL